jgi:prepilin-type N-terminal cleavage/methylation domain-containing protein
MTAVRSIHGLTLVEVLAALVLLAVVVVASLPLLRGVDGQPELRAETLAAQVWSASWSRFNPLLTVPADHQHWRIDLAPLPVTNALENPPVPLAWYRASIYDPRWSEPLVERLIVRRAQTAQVAP